LSEYDYPLELPLTVDHPTVSNQRLFYDSAQPLHHFRHSLLRPKHGDRRVHQSPDAVFRVLVIVRPLITSFLWRGFENSTAPLIRKRPEDLVDDRRILTDEHPGDGGVSLLLKQFHSFMWPAFEHRFSQYSDTR